MMSRDFCDAFQGSLPGAKVCMVFIIVVSFFIGPVRIIFLRFKIAKRSFPERINFDYF